MRAYAIISFTVVLTVLANPANAEILDSGNNLFGRGDDGAPAPAPEYALAPGLDNYGQLKLLLVNASGNHLPLNSVDRLRVG